MTTPVILKIATVACGNDDGGGDGSGSDDDGSGDAGDGVKKNDDGMVTMMVVMAVMAVALTTTVW